jgi:cytidine diphosphoramidate kinase
MIIWLIGLSASGKTVIGKEIHKVLSNSSTPWVFLDGDDFRQIQGESLGHTVGGRKKNADRISNLCKYLDLNNINVVACVLSIFHENQQYNRNTFNNYKEIYIKVNLEIAQKRDNKNLYSKALSNEIKNVVGIDIPFPEPLNPDIIYDNNDFNSDVNLIANEILQSLNLIPKVEYHYSKKDLLSNLHKYQYTKFEGPAFLDAYADSRNESIRELNLIVDKLSIYDKSEYQTFFMIERYNLHKTLSFFLKVELNDLVEPIIINKTVETINSTQLLKHMYQNLTVNNNHDLSKVFILIKRFEVSKRIYKNYTFPNLSRIKSDYKNTTNYLLFSLILIEASNYCNIEEKTIIFNTLLKVNDLIISIRNRIGTPCEIILASICLKKEMEIYQDLKN